MSELAGESSFSDSPREECGIIGVYAPNEEVARMAFFGLFALQHRGQEAAGIAVSDGQLFLRTDKFLYCVGSRRVK